MRRKQTATDVLIEAGFKPANEADLQDRIIALFVAHGAVVERVNSGRMGKVAFVRWFARGMDPETAGASDLVVTLGRTVFVEVKMPGENLKPKQRLFAERIRQAGGTFYVARSEDDAQEIVNVLQEGM